mgnify:CR=1 FL=1
MSYLVIKYIHMTAVTLSITGFVVRGLWMLLNSPMMQRRWVRVAPHFIDTVLLLSAITLAVRIQQYPFVHGWLTAKFVALLVYILLGMVALTYGKTKIQRAAAFAGSVLAFAYIVLVAITKNASPLTVL